jgi:SAM-dependent methyltransferase
VLDVACGDGYLLEHLAARSPASVALHGVDLSAGELQAAQRRLDGRANLRLARAQALPHADGQFDMVLCHMALMLIVPLDKVVREMGRVLKRGGRLAAVVGAPSSPSPSRDVFIAVLRERPVREEWVAVRFGDPRMRSAEAAVQALSGRFHDVRVEAMMSVRRLTPAEIWAWYEGAYDLALRSPVDEAAARTDFLERAGPHADADGRMLFPVNLHRITATR